MISLYIYLRQTWSTISINIFISWKSDMKSTTIFVLALKEFLPSEWFIAESTLILGNFWNAVIIERNQ